MYARVYGEGGGPLVLVEVDGQDAIVRKPACPHFLSSWSLCRLVPAVPAAQSSAPTGDHEGSARQPKCGRHRSAPGVPQQPVGLVEGAIKKRQQPEDVNRAQHPIPPTNQHPMR